MHGQTRIEFIFAIVIFSIIVFYIVTQINTVFSNIISEYEINSLKAEANSMITTLINDKGNPEDWENIAENNPEDVKRVGLAIRPYDLSKNKIANLSYNCSLMSNFDIIEYRLKIYNSTDSVLFCGIDSLKPPKIFVMKYVIIENGLGNITLELW